MGLSNEERYNKIIYSINSIVELSDSLTEHDTVKLKKLAERLWYAFLKNDSDGAFWILGSDLSNENMPHGTLVGVAFSAHKPSSCKEFDDDEDRYYDHYKVLRRFFDMERLLSTEKRAVLLIHVNTQNIAYAMCRYKDEFMERYEDLNVLIRTIQGECFKLMQEDRDYVHAWMLHNLCDKVYTIEENDLVNQWWTKDCNSHSIHIHFDKFEEVFDLYKKYQFRTMSVQDRIDVTLALMGAKYGEYDHIHKHFMGTVNAYNQKNEVKINVQAIEDAFKTAKETKAEKLAEIYERQCHFTGNYINRKGEVENFYE